MKIAALQIPAYELFDLSPDLVCVADEDGYFQWINKQVCDTLEYTREELLELPISFFIHEADKESTARERLKMIKGKALTNFHNRYISKSGKIIWLEWTSIFINHQSVVFAIAKNITERKEKELRIEERYEKIKSMASHFKNRIESDRKYLAVELHEELAQLAVVIKLDVSWIHEHIAESDPELAKRAEQVLVATGLLLDTIKRIAFSVSPSTLEDLGLNETLYWLCREFTLLNKINCNFNSVINDESINAEQQLDIFRICQESLRNIMQHAKADEVNVDLIEEGNRIVMNIQDNGTGFNTADIAHQPGITLMRELASSINGKFQIESTPGYGTQVKFSVRKY
jgi:PAS domain S-box-containing protein